MRRHPLLTFFLSLLLLAVVAGAIFVATFDLNSHRSRLQSLLSDSLSRPVTLGEARLSLRHGLALSFSALEIPPAPPATWDLQAERIFVRLDLLPLLVGKLRFSEVLIDSPELQVVLLRTGGESPLPDLRGWEIAGFRAISLRHGRLTVEDRRDPARPCRLEVEDAGVRLRHLATGRPTSFSLSGRLRQSREDARFEIAGDLRPAADRRDADLRLGLQIGGLEPAPLLSRYAEAIAATGTVSLQLSLTGSRAAGLQVDGNLAGKDLALTLPGYRSPVAVAKAHLRGNFTPREGGGRLWNSDISLNGMAIRGDLGWQRQNGEMQLEANLATPPLPLPDLLRLLPDRWGTPLRQKSAGGFLEIEALRFAGPASALRSPGENFPLQTQVKVHQLTFPRSNGNHLTLSFRAALTEDLLQIEAGEATLLGNPFRFAGTLERPFGPRPELTAEVEGTPDAKRLSTELPPAWRQNLAATGPLPVFLWISGKDERLLIDLQADLTRIAASWGEARKPAGLPGTLLLAGEINSRNLELSHARLRLPPLDLRARGRRTIGKTAPFSLVLDAVGFDLRSAGTHLPQLARMQARGELDLHLELTGEGGRLLRREGEIRLRGVGLHLGRVIADLQQAEGTLRIRPDKIEIERLTALLGSSPITAEGVIGHFPDPRAEVRVRARSIRADEVIFPSEKAYLRDLDAHLLLSRKEIAFDPAQVRLDGGTRATVRGSVRLLPQPRVELDIEAARGNIDEVIALWERPEGKAPEPTNGRKTGLAVRIAAHAAQGEFRGLLFQQATGLITWGNGLLSIHPLHFRIGEGRGEGVIIVDSRTPPSLLQISGHLEGVDAAAVHGQVLKSRGLVTGRLNGDFYLEGNVGSGFLESSRGGLNLEIRDGVLRKFTSLAKVFSILNVSQILTLQLPDMAREGMPFNRLTGTFSLDGGVIATEDLLVDSNAMNLSVVGQADLKSDQLDFVMGVRPLKTVDRIVTSIPVAGWLLAGEEKALITAHFLIRGSAEEPSVKPVPITSVSEKARGIFRRVFNLPGKMIEGMGGLVNDR